jgi:hypothetical protein
VSAESSFSSLDHHGSSDGSQPAAGSTLATILAFLRRLFGSDRI